MFNDACDAAGIPTDIKRIFMGKSDPANKPYGGKSKQDLEMYYELVEPNLTVFSEPEINPSHETNELKKQMEEMKLQRDQDKIDTQKLVLDILKKQEIIED